MATRETEWNSSATGLVWGFAVRNDGEEGPIRTTFIGIELWWPQGVDVRKECCFRLVRGHIV